MRLWFGLAAPREDYLRYMAPAEEVTLANTEILPLPHVGYGAVPGEDGVNERGFRNPPVEIPKPDDTFRILALGGSTTFGQFVEQGDDYPAQLGEILRDEYGYQNVEPPGGVRSSHGATSCSAAYTTRRTDPSHSVRFLRLRTARDVRRALLPALPCQLLEEPHIHSSILYLGRLHSWTLVVAARGCSHLPRPCLTLPHPPLQLRSVALEMEQLRWRREQQRQPQQQQQQLEYLRLPALQELARLLQLAPRHVILAEEELCFLDHAQIQVGLSSAATSGPPLPCVRRKVQLRALMKPQGQQTEGARGRAGALLLFWRCLRP